MEQGFVSLLLARGRHCGVERAISWTLPCISSLARSAKWPNGLYVLPSISIFFSPLGKLAGRAIYFTRRFFLFFFFIIFFNDFSETNYLKIRRTDFRKLYVEWKLFGHRWSIWTSFSVSQGTLPWQPILCKNGQNCLPTLHLSLCHSETESAIVLRMSALKAPLIAPHRAKNGENRFSSFSVKPG